MKNIKSNIVNTKQFSVSEIITETKDVVSIAKHILSNIKDVSTDVKRDLNLAINNLNQATTYLDHLNHKICKD
ncbi:MAG: hypothetical protein J5742_02970 [Alphaproteobacteria bacterium]|nr:hypothetical protein [Alphaproteobacteria bacterium]